MGYGRGVHRVHRGAPAFSPDHQSLRGAPAFKSRESRLPEPGKWGNLWGEAGLESGWAAEGLGWAPMEGRSAPRARPCPGPSPKTTTFRHPQPTHWTSWGPPATAPQTLRESRPGQPGHSLQGALINQTSLPCGHSPATGSRPPSGGSLGARCPVPQGDPSTCSPPRGSRTRPSAPLSAPTPGLDTDLCRGHTGPSGWQPVPSWTEK